MTKTIQIPMTFNVKRLVSSFVPTEVKITLNEEVIADSTDDEYGMFNFDNEAMDFLTNDSTERIFDLYLKDFVTEYCRDILTEYNEIIITIQ